ncbi:MAG: type II 3-dehydroquinate dehydratase [Gammaproteobacteria bacterium]
MARLLVINGPNLNLLGRREPEIYGRTTLPELEARLAAAAAERGHEASCFQANGEGALVERIHAAADEGVELIIINPGAYTHTSVALRDALLGVAIPFIEVHISNVHAREPFRRHSYLADVAVGVIAGLGLGGYELALAAVDEVLAARRRAT